jgi:hypothetical protein
LDRLLTLLGALYGAGRQVHDTNIVAAMLEHGISRLLTFNAADFQALREDYRARAATIAV